MSQPNADASLGSPPPMRGKAAQFNFCFVCTQDHPRLCGEKESVQTPDTISTGSPPPMRGKDKEEEMCDAEYRITPAYAGKSLALCGAAGGFWDHPRLCGEKIKQIQNVCLLSGSPPPMRGKASITVVLTSRSRITPAYAGKSNRLFFCLPIY